MKKLMRSAFALLLAVLMIASLAAAAYADPGSVYADEQFYEEDEGLDPCYTVQVSAGCSLEGAEYTRWTMLNAGFDCFVYQVGSGYRIMCGKFQNKQDAVRYRDMIREKTGREKAYVTEARLPDSAREDFLAGLKQDPLVVGKVDFSNWETPTGAFLDMTANEEETSLFYTVEYSGGTNFKIAEARRDELIAQGYDATVVKTWGCYHVLTGAFENRDEARALRNEIRLNTGHWGAGVLAIQLPAGALG